MTRLTREERLAIAALRRLATRWPKSLWLFTVSGVLHVMHVGPDGTRAEKPGTDYRGGYPPPSGYDPEYTLTTVDIPNDGGDW